MAVLIGKSMNKFHTPTLEGFPLLTGGSGGRPRWSAATADPLHTLWLQPKMNKQGVKK